MPPQLDPQMLALLAGGQGAQGPIGAAGDPSLSPVPGAPTQTPQDDPLLSAIAGTAQPQGDFPGLDPSAYEQILGPAMAQGATGLVQALPAIEQLQEHDRQLLAQQHESVLQAIIQRLLAPQAGQMPQSPAPMVGGESRGF